MLPASKLPLIGASGAVAGVIAAYLILHPRVLVWVLAFRFIPLRISAAWVLGVWVATQLVMVLVRSIRPGGLVGACRRHGCRRHPHPVHAPARRSLVRPLANARLTAPDGLLARPLRNMNGCLSVVQSAAPVAQLTPNCCRPTLLFALAKCRILPS